MNKISFTFIMLVGILCLAPLVVEAGVPNDSQLIHFNFIQNGKNLNQLPEFDYQCYGYGVWESADNKLKEIINISDKDYLKYSGAQDDILNDKGAFKKPMYQTESCNMRVVIDDNEYLIDDLWEKYNDNLVCESQYDRRIDGKYYKEAGKYEKCVKQADKGYEYCNFPMYVDRYANQEEYQKARDRCKERSNNIRLCNQQLEDVTSKIQMISDERPFHYMCDLEIELLGDDSGTVEQARSNIFAQFFNSIKCFILKLFKRACSL